LESFTYKKSDLIVTLSAGMLENIKKRFGYNKLVSIPNSANLNLFSKVDDNIVLPDFYKSGKVAIYTGNIGAVNNSFLLLNTAIELEKLKSNVVIVLIGQGQQREEIASIISEKELNNIVILDLMPKIDLITFIKKSMISLVPLNPNPIMDTSSPNKLFESLAAGVPVIQTTNGWLKDLISVNNCGYTLPADNPVLLANKLNSLASDENLIASLKTNALHAAKNFDKDILADKMISSIEAL
jgi:glycosyltransferase involved in cell wall biosynthesis